MKKIVKLKGSKLRDYKKKTTPRQINYVSHESKHFTFRSLISARERERYRVYSLYYFFFVRPQSGLIATIILIESSRSVVVYIHMMRTFIKKNSCVIKISCYRLTDLRLGKKKSLCIETSLV